MKALALFPLILLAACGGGASSPVPGPTPTHTVAPTQYTARIVQVGGAVSKTSSTLRHVRDTSSATPAPIILVAPNPSGRFSGTFFDGIAEAHVEIAPSPAPSATPVVAWSAPTSAPYVLAAPTIPNPTLILIEATGIPNFSNIPITANVTVPATLSVTNTVQQLSRGLLGCIGDAYANAGQNIPSDYQGGFQISNGSAVGVSDRQSADAMMIGQYCGGAFADPTHNAPTLNFPFGASIVSQATKNIFDVRLSDFTATGPTIIDPVAVATSTSGDIIVFKTANGQVWAWLVDFIQPAAAPVGPSNGAEVTGGLLQVTQ